MGEMSSWETYAGAATGGAFGGLALLYTANPYFAGAVSGTFSNGTTQILERFVTSKRDSVDFYELAFNTGFGALTGAIPGKPKIAGVNAGRGSYNQIFQQMRTKAINGQATSIRPQTAFKMAGGAFYHNAFAQGAAASSFASSLYKPVVSTYNNYNSGINFSNSIYDYGYNDYMKNSPFFNNK